MSEGRGNSEKGNQQKNKKPRKKGAIKRVSRGLQRNLGVTLTIEFSRLSKEVKELEAELYSYKQSKSKINKPGNKK